MAKKQLSELEKRFLDALFSKEALGDYEVAKQLAGYSENTPTNQIASALAEEIKERTYQFMALNSPRAAIKMIEGLNGEKPISKEVLKISTEVLDRGGVVKREQVDVHVDTPNAVIILPAKEL